MVTKPLLNLGFYVRLVATLRVLVAFLRDLNKIELFPIQVFVYEMLNLNIRKKKSWLETYQNLQYITNIADKYSYMLLNFFTHYKNNS